jgi:hypothetical protein
VDPDSVDTVETTLAAQGKVWGGLARMQVLVDLGPSVEGEDSGSVGKSPAAVDKACTVVVAVGLVAAVVAAFENVAVEPEEPVAADMVDTDQLFEAPVASQVAAAPMVSRSLVSTLAKRIWYHAVGHFEQANELFQLTLWKRKSYLFHLLPMVDMGHFLEQHRLVVRRELKRNVQVFAHQDYHHHRFPSLAAKRTDVVPDAMVSLVHLLEDFPAVWVERQVYHL